MAWYNRTMAHKGYSRQKAEALMQVKELDSDVLGEGVGFTGTPDSTGVTRRVAKLIKNTSGENKSWYFGFEQSKALKEG